MIDEEGAYALDIFTESLIKLAHGNVCIHGWDTLTLLSPLLHGCLLTVEGEIGDNGVDHIASAVMRWGVQGLEGLNAEDAPEHIGDDVIAESSAFFDAMLSDNEQGAINVVRALRTQYDNEICLLFLCSVIVDGAVMEMARLAPDSVYEVTGFRLPAGAQ